MKEEITVSQPVGPEAGRSDSETGSQSQPWAPGLTAEEREALDKARKDPNQIVERAVPQLKKLGDISVILVILNRCIGLFIEILFRA
jgi:hypothetical protein